MSSNEQLKIFLATIIIDPNPINVGHSALTDALIAGIANGSKAYKLVGSYVATPLNWSPFPLFAIPRA